MEIPMRGIAGYLDAYLRLSAFLADPSHNGLQVEARRPVRRIVTAVDATVAAAKHAADAKADLLLVHHGISFRDSLAYLTGRNYAILKVLLDSGIGLYAAHAPLDAHPVVGNNAVMTRLLGLKGVAPFGEDRGLSWGLAGTLPKALKPDAFLSLVEKRIAKAPYAYLPHPVKKVAIVSGGGASFLAEAKAKGYDTLLTGETSHTAAVTARDLSFNLVCAGHYATEVFGVQALGAHLKRKFGVAVSFFDDPTGL